MHGGLVGFGISDGIHSHYSPLYCRLITESSDPGKALKTVTFYHLLFSHYSFFMHAPIIPKEIPEYCASAADD